MTNTIKAKDVQSKKAKAFISFILDESGSMSVGRETIVKGMNEQIQTLKSRFKDGLVEPVVSFVKFADNVITLYEGKPIDNLREFEIMGYNPNGSTALYDAVGATIDMMEKMEGINDEGNSALLIVITDGEENASKKFNSKQIAEKIQTLQGTKKWTITYLGPNNVDLSKVNKTTQISYGNLYSTDLTSARGYTMAFNAVNVGLNNWISGSYCAATSGCSFSSDSFYGDNTGTYAATDADKIVGSTK